MSDPTSPAGHTHTIYDGKTLREVIQMCEQAHACANELQRQLSEAQQLCVELEEELAAAQATIKRHEVAKTLCLELLALKENSYAVNTLAEKIHYALS